MPTSNKSYKHTGHNREDQMVRPDYEKARDSDLKTRDDFRISHSNRPDWYDEGRKDKDDRSQ